MITIGRFSLTEPYAVAEGGERTLEVSGREAWPIRDRAEVVARHEDVLALPGALLPLTMSVHSERSGYYTVLDASSTITDIAHSSGYADWSLSLLRHGADTDLDLESRLTGAVRANDFGLAGERWHAPSIGHYAYYTGATIPSSMTRTGADGAMTVYRSVPADTSPRWGCALDDYLAGRVRIDADFPPREVTGMRPLGATWELSNALVQVKPLASGGSLEIASFTGGAWRPKNWQIDAGAVVTSWESATILHNTPEICVLRLTENRSPTGRAVLDLTLRRGARIVEGYLQRGDSGTLAVYLATPEAQTDNSASGYVVASADDADGNRFTAGSARSFTAHADGGVSKTAVTAIDFYAGVVAGGGTPASGDSAVNLRDQYIASLPEIVAATRR